MNNNLNIIDFDEEENQTGENKILKIIIILIKLLFLIKIVNKKDIKGRILLKYFYGEMWRFWQNDEILVKWRNVGEMEKFWRNG